MKDLTTLTAEELDQQHHAVLDQIDLLRKQAIEIKAERTRRANETLIAALQQQIAELQGQSVVVELQPLVLTTEVNHG